MSIYDQSMYELTKTRIIIQFMIDSYQGERVGLQNCGSDSKPLFQNKMAALVVKIFPFHFCTVRGREGMEAIFV